MSTELTEKLTATVEEVAHEAGTPPAVRDEIVSMAQKELSTKHPDRIPAKDEINDALERAEKEWGRKLRNALYAFDTFGG